MSEIADADFNAAWSAWSRSEGSLCDGIRAALAAVLPERDARIAELKAHLAGAQAVLRMISKLETAPVDECCGKVSGHPPECCGEPIDGSPSGRARAYLTDPVVHLDMLAAYLIEAEDRGREAENKRLAELEQLVGNADAMLEQYNEVATALGADRDRLAGELAEARRLMTALLERRVADGPVSLLLKANAFLARTAPKEPTDAG